MIYTNGENNQYKCITWTRTKLRPLCPQGTEGWSQKCQNETEYNLYAPDVLLVFNANLACADINGNFRNSTSALLHQVIYIDTPTLCLAGIIALFV